MKNKLSIGIVFVLCALLVSLIVPEQQVRAKETKSLYAFCDSQTNLCGFVDADGKVVIEPVYDSVSTFCDGLAAVQNQDGNWGFIDESGKVIVPLTYKICNDFSEGLAVVGTEDDRYGYVDTTGKLVISLKYIGASSFSEGLAKVKIESGKYGKVGYINPNGKMVIKAQYDDGYSFSDGLARVRKGNSVLYIDKNGKTQISKKLKNDDSDYLDFSENLASFYSNGKFGFINKKGKCVFVLGSNITYADDFYDGRCLVYNQKGKVGYINKKGKVVIPTKYDDGSVFQEGMAYVKIKNKYDLRVKRYSSKDTL